jgi:protein CLEC16A
MLGALPLERRVQQAFMSKNLQVDDANREQVVESLRLIAEIVIWGDQNDPRVFE